MRAIRPLTAWRGGLFLEYVDGLTLENVIAVRRNRPGTLGRSLELAAKLLATLHAHGARPDESPDFESPAAYTRKVVGDLVRWGVLTLFGGFYVWQLGRVGSSTRSFLSSLYWTMFVFLSFAVLWFQPWYVVSLAALGAILLTRGIAEMTLLFSYSVTWAYMVYTFFFVWFFPIMMAGNSLGMNATAVLLLEGVSDATTALSILRLRFPSYPYLKRAIHIII